MSSEQIMIFLLILSMLFFFVWGKWRYDIVALMALIISYFLGLVPIEKAFEGFSNPAVITVAAVLIVSKGLMNAGVVDSIARILFKVGDNTLLQLSLLMLTVTISSAFMNNIGALALMMPVAIKMARRNNKSPSLFLMPLAFGSLLGGMMTLVGTPPNIIISIFRSESIVGKPYGMFDFTLVGAGVALAGILFILLFGWRLLPERKAGKSSADLFEIKDYVAELLVPSDSKHINKTITDIENITEGELKVISISRKNKIYAAPSLSFKLHSEDLLIIQATAEELQELLDSSDLILADTEKLSQDDIRSDDIEIVEAIVMTNSFLIGRTSKSMKIRSRYGINILGVAREGVRINKSPDSISFKVGDILLLQGNQDTLAELLNQWGCLPLADRGLTLGKPRKLLSGLAIFITALILIALGIIPVEIAFVLVAIIMIIGKFISLKELYESIDWPIIILLGSIIPVSRALETTGGAQLIASYILQLSGRFPPWTAVVLVLVVSMTLSDIVNNAAAVLIMAPIALEISIGMGISFDSLLMSVAIGASCSFLTPIGHQSNTLIMGPGGYKFSDYWKMGLPLEIIVVAVATPLIILFWF